MGKRDIGGADGGACGIIAVIGDRQREADDFRLHDIERRRFGVEGDDAGFARIGDPLVEGSNIANGHVFRMIDRRGGKACGACLGERIRLG